MSSSCQWTLTSSKLFNVYSRKSLFNNPSKSNSIRFPHRNHTYLLRLSATFDDYNFTEKFVEQSPQTTEQDDDDEDYGEDEEEPSLSESGDEARLFVGNLPYKMTSSQLSEIFGEAGRVVSSQIVYDRVTDRSRGFGFLSMRNVEEAKEAIRLFNGSQIGGRTVKVNFPEVPRGGERAVMGPKIQNSNRGFVDSPHKIYAGNLGWGVTSEGLRDTFANQPGFLSAKVVYERGSARSRGFGFVSFETAEDAQAALDAMNGVEVEGRPLRLNMAEVKASPSRTKESSLDSSNLLSSIGS